MTPAQIVAREHFAWPGGYELFGITDDGGVLCFKCCESEAALIADAYPGDGWNVVTFDHTGNDDGRITCDHCYRVIQVDWEDAS